MLVWLGVILNWIHLSVLRLEPLPLWCRMAGNGVLVLQVTAFLLTQTTDPGSPPSDWVAAAATGREPTAVPHHNVPGVMLPPRARYVRRLGRVILHFDHYCWFLQRPIGLRNRKFFVLFTCYSFLLSSFALAINAWEILPLYVGAFRRIPEPGFNASEFAIDFSTLPAEIRTDALQDSYLDYAFARHRARVGGLYLGKSLYALLAVNICAVCFLGDLASRSLLHALHNRVTLAPEDDRFDVGIVANARQIFGRRSLLWLLPVPGTASPGDGLSFPMSKESLYVVGDEEDDPKRR